MPGLVAIPTVNTWGAGLPLEPAPLSLFWNRMRRVPVASPWQDQSAYRDLAMRPPMAPPIIAAATISRPHAM